VKEGESGQTPAPKKKTKGSKGKSKTRQGKTNATATERRQQLAKKRNLVQGKDEKRQEGPPQNLQKGIKNAGSRKKTGRNKAGKEGGKVQTSRTEWGSFHPKNKRSHKKKTKPRAKEGDTGDTYKNRGGGDTQYIPNAQKKVLHLLGKKKTPMLKMVETTKRKETQYRVKRQTEKKAASYSYPQAKTLQERHWAEKKKKGKKK